MRNTYLLLRPMAYKYPNIIPREKLTEISKGAVTAFLFCTLFGAVVTTIHYILSEFFNPQVLTSSAFFGYIAGCAFFVRDELLKIISQAHLSHSLKQIPLSSLSSIITVGTISYISSMYLFIMN